MCPNWLTTTSNDPSGSLSSDTVNINEIQLLASAGDVPRKVAETIGDITPGVLALKPKVLILDESTSGVDPQGRLAIRDVVAALRDDGVTVVLTTHDLDDGLRSGMISPPMLDGIARKHTGR